MKSRYLKKYIAEDLQEKIVFLGGPRQVGKTSLSLDILLAENALHPGYINWDTAGVASPLLKGILPAEKLIVLDEIHKYARWRNLIKGFWDKYKSEKQFLVTGSARLDYYRKGGDSLQGRYHYYRLHPFSLGELDTKFQRSSTKSLLEFGGFPEPLFKGQEKFWRRWNKERFDRVINEDLRDLERVKEISLLAVLAETLPSKVGSPLSVKSLREDLQVDHKTAERWIQILENLYYCFRIAPYGSPKIRAVKKEQKLYMYDWSLITDIGFRFENLVASQLLKYCHFLEDTEGHRMELRFLRSVEGREVDFVVLKNNSPLFAVEVKSQNQEVSPHLKYFKERTPIPKFYQVHLGSQDFETPFTRVLPFETLCRELQLP